MAANNPEDSRLLQAASMYYMQDFTMEAIAKHLGTSRSTVSRMIKRARNTGLVEITLNPRRTTAPGLGEEIRSRFGIEAYVVPVPDQTSPAQRLEQVAMTTARLLGSWFVSGMTLGVAWGNTLSAISRHLGHRTTRGSAVVQLNGAASPRTSGIPYAGELIARFGASFDAQVHHFPVPAFFDYAETKRAMWGERSIRRVLDVQRNCDIVLFSVGALSGLVPSHVYSAGYLDKADAAALEEYGVVGDVCTVFMRADGTYRDININDRATGPSPHELRHIPRRMCAVSGDNKVVPLLGALRAEVVTDLIIDETTAAALLDQPSR